MIADADLLHRLERLADRWLRLAETTHMRHADILTACAAELAAAVAGDDRPKIEEAQHPHRNPEAA